jgi:hypothetical protein
MHEVIEEQSIGYWLEIPSKGYISNFLNKSKAPKKSEIVVHFENGEEIEFTYDDFVQRLKHK